MIYYINYGIRIIIKYVLKTIKKKNNFHKIKKNSISITTTNKQNYIFGILFQ